MASNRELRRRIKSTQSTRQITKAMELVSSSKMRRASEAALASRPYSTQLWAVLEDILGPKGQELTHPLLTVRPVKKILVVVVSSDRGLAGIYNSAVLKQALSLENQLEPSQSIDYITIGKKAASSLARLKKNVIQSYPQFAKNPATTDLLPIAEFIEESYIKEEYDRVQIIYTHFFSMLKSEAMTKQILPLVEDKTDNYEPTENRHFVYEPSSTVVLDSLLPRLVEIRLFQAILESLAAEHSSRRVAMKSATDNATEMIDDLVLTYNGMRQDAITRELSEITAGAEALAQGS